MSSTNIEATTFLTAIGWCGVTWSDAGIHSVQLPCESPRTLRALLAADTGGAIVDLDRAPQSVRTAARRIDGVTHGANDDLGDIVLDESGLSDFARSIYRTLRGIGPGDTVSYGELAHLAGHHSPNMARAVGQVLGRNPFGIVVPCHRVTAADGRIGGFSAHGGTVTKIRLLRAEMRGDVSAAMPWDLDEAHRHLRQVDPDMARLLDLVGHRVPRMRVATSTVAALCESIVAQQVSTAAASTIHARLCAQFPHPLAGPTASGLAKLSDAQLRSAGLSASKVAAVRDLAARSLAGEVPELGELADLDDEDIIEVLTPIRGIGRWTVEMLLIFRLGRADLLPVDDLAVRKGYASLVGRDSVGAAELGAIGRAWAPWRSVAAWYLWRASELS